MTQKPIRSTVKEMTQGKPSRLILSFAWPLFLSQLFQQLYNTADTLIVGNALGTEALAAVSSSGTLIFLMVSFFNGLSMGAGVVIGRYFGAGREDQVSRAIHTDIAVGLTAGSFLTVAGMLLTPTLLTIMNTDPDVMPQAQEYFFYYFLGSLALVMYNTLMGIMNALGDSKRPLYYLIISSLINIVLDLFLVGYLKLGVWAAAIATVLSQANSCVLCLRHLTRKGQIYTVSFRKIRFHRDMLREILRMGIPSGVQNSVIALANVIVQSQINVFEKFATAAYGVHSKIEGFAFLPITSFNMAITTFISQNLGAGKYQRARSGARFGILCAVIMAETIGVLYFIFAPSLVSVFDRTEQVILFGTRQARTASLFYFLLAFSHSIASVCRGAGKAIVPMFVMLSVWCVLRVAYIFTVMQLFHEIGYIYAAYPITWCISSIIYGIYYLKSDWVHGFDAKKPRLKKTGEEA